MTEERDASFSPRGSACDKHAPIRPSGTFPRKRGKEAARAGEHWASRSSASPARALNPLSCPWRGVGVRGRWRRCLAD
ncbi:hypothetical protein XFF6991_570266 [Xanthomonas phaseoli pv. phaseoli]|uniref:Uncharacterized protein n=1 Tax=Xanthomonas campestris pv. phaseoli TaxID=317013 RepID=A0A7Z7J696_XANCH|nr:hypothetical protein XFF6991_570266 [Xanthomonas phaseoli pv. phaseoli]